MAEGGRLPDFVIAGAPRSGTTWLYRVLDAHPALWMAKPLRPEPKFFLVDDEYDRGLGYYSARWFSSVTPGTVAGEKSTNYLESPTAAGRLAGDLPEAKLIFMLREPADRAFSNYRFTLMNGLEELDFAAALQAEAQREAAYPDDLRFTRPFSYFSRGLYAQHLSRWFALFDRSRILVKRYEDIAEAPAQLVTDVHRFLGVEPRPDVEHVGVVNAAEPHQLDEEVMAGLRHRYVEPNRELTDLLGASLWP